tara:strand:+ start:7400 stop:9772 length:2373 start_codon:yes stop_codon:yes gene_type:complete
MNRLFQFLTLTILMLAAGGLKAAKRIDFNRDVRPILSDKCFACHGPDKEHRKAKLRLDVEEGAKKEVIVAGKPGKSEFMARVISEDADKLMPPPETEKTLTPSEKDLLMRWIEQGADYDEYWAYVKPKKHPVPEVREEWRPINWIDRFVFKRVADEGLSPSPDADKITLIRRLSFDLTGLPPTPAEVDAFANSMNSKAYEATVDRMLASRHFGERLAMYWLDLVRYADSVGYHGDQTHAISPYRDYVIDAFHRNKPFDVFTREQLAGDLLEKPSMEQKIATGYNRLMQTTHEGGAQEKEYLAIYMADRIRNLSSVWMGATVGCAQCHDHKYDPYTAKDFYSLAAYFADVDENRPLSLTLRRGLNFNTLPSPRPPELLTGPPAKRKRWGEIESQVKSLVAATKKEKDAKKKAAMTGELKNLQAEQASLRDFVRRTMVTASVKPRPIRLLPRGDWLDDSGPLMKPAIPEFMGRAKGTSRLDLANWLLDPKDGTGGLTARVMVNRLWYLCFGVGIARDLDDFGGQGEPPVHPELLDNLAVDFYENGWGIKRVIKQIVMSRAYRQSSLVSPRLLERDPLNRLYARQSRYRLDAEMVRDTALRVSGLMVDKFGGRPAKPYQPAGYYRHLNFPARKYRHDNNENQWRRGVYMHWQRQYLHPMLKAMDAPSREECTAQRPRSNTPTAALTLLNDPTFVEAARAFAARILTEAGDSVFSRIDFLFRNALSRPPDAFEREQVTELLIQSRREYRQSTERAEDLVQVGLTKNNDHDPVDLAAWTTVTRTILNLHETIARN